MRTYNVCEQGFMFLRVRARNLKAAVNKARRQVDTSCYERRLTTLWCDFHVIDADDTSVHTWFTLRLEAKAPPCALGRKSHAWQHRQTRYSGAGMRIVDSCQRCATERIYRSNTNRPDTGEQGHELLEYRTGE